MSIVALVLNGFCDKLEAIYDSVQNGPDRIDSKQLRAQLIKWLESDDNTLIIIKTRFVHFEIEQVKRNDYLLQKYFSDAYANVCKCLNREPKNLKICF